MATRSLREPPAPEAKATFAKDFGRRAMLTVDTEEEFDWRAPFSRDDHGTRHVEALPRFQSFCEEIGAHPVYLVDWAIVQDQRAVEIIGDAADRGAADVGLQLHPWVNPPFEEELSIRNSYAGNLPPELEAEKFRRLRDAIEERFGSAPLIYRAGRYGVGEHTARLLKDCGFAIDSSVRSLFDYSPTHGPDFSSYPLHPYWLDDERSLLELPVTSVYWGMLRQLGRPLQRLQRHIPTFYSFFSRAALLERIALTPEGVTKEEALRGIDIALDDGLELLVLSFHSPSLAPGFTPYVRTQEDVEILYDWLRSVYGYFAIRGVKSATVAEVIAAAKR